MDDAVRVRRAAHEALADIVPEELATTLDDRLADASMTPGVLVFVSARAIDPGVDRDAVADRAAGVQLVYEGLRLTRSLAAAEPWLDSEESDIDADLDIVAADVLVARGFYLLARTGAADKAVETVRAFGRDQTRRREVEEADAAALDRNLEADVFELAVVAGATAVGDDPSAPLLEYAAGLARDHEGDLPAAAAVLPETAPERIAALSGAGSSSGSGSGSGSDDRVPPSATDR